MSFTFWHSLFLSILTVAPMNFIKELDHFEEIDHFNIIKLGDFPDFKFQDLNLPKIIFTNLPKIVLKFIFSSNTLTIVLLDEPITLSMVILKKVLYYNNLSKVVVVVKSEKYVRKVFSASLEQNILNVLVLVSDSNETYSYDFDHTNHTEIRIHKATSFPRPVTNINQKMILLLFQNELPAAFSIIEEDTPTNYAGYMLRMLTEFVNHLNGTFLPLPVGSQGQKMDKSTFFDNSQWDFMSTFETPSARNPNLSILENLQWKSDVLEMLTWRIIVPIPKPIAERRYFSMPFSKPLLVLYVVTGLYAMILLYVQRRFSSSKDNIYNDYVCNAFRAMLSLSYNFDAKFEPIQVRIVMLFLTGLGFICVTWYSAILGSFVTTFLYEKPALTLENIVQSGLKIAISEEDFNMELNVDQKFPKSIFVRKSRADVLAAGDQFNISFGYAIYEERWKYYFLPMMRFFQGKQFLETNIALEIYYFQIYFRHDSIYKDVFNKFIHTIRDTGLYSYWTRMSFYDILNLQEPELTIRNLTKPSSSLRVLTLEFFLFAFLLLKIGMVCGLVALLAEILWFKVQAKK